MLALIVFGCVGKAPETQAPTGPIPEVSAPIPEASAPPVAPAAAAVPGRYDGPACGKREYVRQIDLRVDGSYEIQDLVAPCPPDVACMWSGILTFTGTWVETAQGIGVTEAPGAQGPEGQPRAAAYTRTAGGLVDGEGCAYAKVGG